jgi:hypothetical protein
VPNSPTTPLVSIIVTFHNNIDHVATALQLIDAQTFTDAELLLVDDGSSDGTTAALAAAAKVRPRAELVAISPNGGVASARNHAVSVARGEFIWFVDCDDVWEPNILESLAAAARDTGSDIVNCRAVRGSSAENRESTPLDGMPELTTVDHQDAVRALVRRILRGYLWNKLIRRELMGVDPFPKLSSQSDYAGVIGMVGRAKSVTFLPEVLYTHLVRPGSITNGSNPNLRNLEYCWQHARELAVSSGAFEANDRELEFFDYTEYYVAAIDTFYRSGSDSAASIAQLREIRKAMKLGAILRVMRRDFTVGAAALGFTLTGSAFGRAYRVYRRASRRAVFQ